MFEYLKQCSKRFFPCLLLVPLTAVLMLFLFNNCSQAFKMAKFGQDLGSVNQPPGASPSKCKDYAVLSWTPPQNPDGSSVTNLAGYKVFYGNNSGQYGTPIIVNDGGISTYQVNKLSPGTYYFALKAFNTSGTESDYSNEASLNLKECVL